MLSAVIDLLSGGPSDRAPRRWLKVASVMVTVVAAVGVGLGYVLTGGSPAFPPSAVPSHRASSSPPALTLAPPSPPADVVVEPRLAGMSAVVAGGVRLVVGGPHPIGVGAGAPRLSGLPVPAGWELTGVRAVPAGLLAVVQRLQLVDTAPSSKMYLVRPGGAAVLLTAADVAVPAFGGQAIFALRMGATGPGSPANPPGVLSEVSLSGRILDRHPVPAGFDLLADTGAGLLVTVSPSSRGVDLQVLDRATLAVRQRLGTVSYVLAATSTRVAWVTPGCTDTCQLVVVDVPAGARHTIALEPGYQAGAAAFSPDGRHLAVSYYGRHPQLPGGAAPGVLDMVDLTTGQTQRIPGVNTAIKQAADLAWTPDGRWLAVAVGYPTRDFRRIGLLPTAGGPIHVLPGHVPGGYLTGALLAV